MTDTYFFSRNALLKRVGLSPGRKLLVSFLSLVLITLPLNYVYNSISIILFVLYSILSYRREDVRLKFSLLLPVFLFTLMALSTLWSINWGVSLMALSKEASLLFIPLAFCINRSLNRKNLTSILNNYSVAMCLYCVYYLVRACIRYTTTDNIDVFFYNELATPHLSAVYLAAFSSVALFVFLCKRKKNVFTAIAFLLLLTVIFLLSVKVIIIIDLLLVVLYIIFSGLTTKERLLSLGAFALLSVALAYYGQVYKNTKTILESAFYGEAPPGMVNVSIDEAWKADYFENNSYFNTVAFRVYQARVFSELVKEDNIFLSGYGLNTSGEKIYQKGFEHNIAHCNEEEIEYNRLNFHNQYIEVFADLGIVGLVILLIIVLINLKAALNSKYFVHIAFAVLMISLFLTESFLWRQRGVVFFTVLYCLLNDVLSLRKKHTT